MKARFLLAALVSVLVLVLQLAWSGRGSPTWAAPGQNPHMQTVPTRPRTPTPTSSTDPIFPTPSVEQPGGDEDDESPATLVIEEDALRPSPARVEPPDSIGSSPTAVPLSTVAAHGPDYPTTAPAATISGTREDNSRSFSAPAASTRTLTSSPSAQRVQLLASPAPAPVSIGESEQPSKIPSLSHWTGSPFWLYALGLGLLLILAGVILVKRS